MSEFKGLRAYVERSRKDRRKRRMARGALTMLSVLVTVGVFAGLSIPAITRSSDPVCGITAHTHADECYEAVLCRADRADHSAAETDRRTCDRGVRERTDGRA